MYRTRQSPGDWIVEVGSRARDPWKVWKLAGPAVPPPV
jgi:hypothetical protein